MGQQQSGNRFKHFDFMVIDVVCLQMCFVISYWFNESFTNPYESDRFQYIAIIILASQLVAMLVFDNYRGIMRRGKLAEAIAVGKFALEVFFITVIYLFLVRRSVVASRMQLGCTFVFFLVIDYVLRRLNKYRIRKFDIGQKKSLMLITSSRLLGNTMEQLTNSEGYHDYFVSGVLLLDGVGDDGAEVGDYGIPIGRLDRDAIEDISHKWVDEVFIMQPGDQPLPPQLMDDLLEMGMTVDYTTEFMAGERWPVADVRKLGGYCVLTSSIRLATVGQGILKRAVDIVGGLVGCLITGILFVFVAPAIYRKSPGPVIFKQERVGRNGKTFMMYKFRSMYLDAEERKAALMEQNKIKDGMMFKMADDPRIIGSEKKDASGRPKGIGNFIRRTSIDEFPQFINVLKGDMSLVGTRPPTLDEWVKYDLGHRVRMSIKPGITGLWQVSGRSEITDFREVVQLDRTYIDTWSLYLDFKILLKTVVVVVKRSGVE